MCIRNSLLDYFSLSFKCLEPYIEKILKPIKKIIDLNGVNEIPIWTHQINIKMWKVMNTIKTKAKRQPK